MGVMMSVNMRKTQSRMKKFVGLSLRIDKNLKKFDLKLCFIQNRIFKRHLIFVLPIKLKKKKLIFIVNIRFQINYEVDVIKILFHFI